MNCLKNLIKQNKTER